MNNLEDKILKVIEEAGDVGITATQIAKKLKKKRETISHYLWIMKKARKVKNLNRILWIKVNEDVKK